MESEFQLEEGYGSIEWWGWWGLTWLETVGIKKKEGKSSTLWQYNSAEMERKVEKEDNSKISNLII